MFYKVSRVALACVGILGFGLMLFEPPDLAPLFPGMLINFGGFALLAGAMLLNEKSNAVRAHLRAEALFDPHRMRTDRAFRRKLRRWGFPMRGSLC